MRFELLPDEIDGVCFAKTILSVDFVVFSSLPLLHLAMRGRLCDRSLLPFGPYSSRDTPIISL